MNDNDIRAWGTKDSRYAEGFETGVRWNDNTTPGGPYAPSDNKYAQEMRQAWLEGFKDGLHRRFLNHAL